MDWEAHYRAIRISQGNNLVVGCGINPNPDPHAPSSIYPRQEIDLFIEDHDTCNLFLLALAELQSSNRDDDNFSYFSMSAIHGRPAGPWADVTPAVASQNIDPAARYVPTPGHPKPTPSIILPEQPGYCAHSSVLFPTWHRPYLGMFEQSLYLKVREIALRYPEEFNLRNRYVAAAKRFRLPYWDPMLVRYVPRTGTNGPWHCGIPKVLGAGQVRVRTPKDPHMLSNINNPLYCYQFPSKYKYDNKPPFDWKGFWGNKSSTKLRYTSNMFTNRGPDLNGSPNNRRVTQNSSRDPLARREIADFLRQQGARIEKMFFVPKPDAITQAEAYGLFATSAYWSNARTGADKIQFQKYADSSIEEFHGAVHGIIGRGEDPNQTYALRGHMGVVPYSSFDPIFWLHHCNIDRLIAIWQRVNPDAWDFSLYLLEPNQYEPLGLQETPTTPLFPFRRLANKFWDSNACRDTTSLGYKYEDYLVADGDTAAQIRVKIDQFYGWLFQRGSLNIPDRDVTGYPRNTSLAECLSPTVFIDHVEPAQPHDFPPVIPLPPPLPPPRLPRLARGLDHVVLDPKDAGPPVLEDSVSTKLVPAASEELKSAIPSKSIGLVSKVIATSSTIQHTTTETITQDINAVAKDSVAKDKRRTIRYNLPARPTVPRNIRKPNLVTGNPADSHVVKNGKLRYWEALVQFEKFTLSGPFDILFFIGDFAPTARKWFRDKNMIGTVFNWANADVEACPNCRVQAGGGLTIAGGVQLTHSLLDLIKSGKLVNGSRLESLEPEVVVPFLTRNLHWRILDSFGQERQREEIAGLKVQVMERLVLLPLLEGDVSVYEDYTVQADITHGRPGGLNRGEEA